MNENKLAIQIEALLFALGKPMSKKELAQKLDASLEDISGALSALREREAGVRVVDDGKTVELRASAEASALIEEIRKEEFARDIGRAGLEALSAILYRGPLTRAEIDFIRGVNSSQTLRTLLVRGLVRKIPNPKDERSLLYEPTTELLSQLGVTTLSDLPQYESLRSKLAELEEAYRHDLTQ